MAGVLRKENRPHGGRRTPRNSLHPWQTNSTLAMAGV